MTDSNPFAPQQNGPDGTPQYGAAPSDRQSFTPQPEQPYTQPSQQPYTQQYGAAYQQGAPYQNGYQQQGTPYQNGYQQPGAYGAPYGAQPYGYYYGQPAQVDRWNGLCIAGFVLAFIIPPVGLILSVIALVQINKSHEKSKGLTIAGIVISALGTLFFVAVIALAVWAVGFTVDYVEEHPEVWYESGDYSQLDGQLCLPDGTCVDTRDLPDGYDWSDLLDDFGSHDGTEWTDHWQTALGSIPIEMALVD